VNQVTAALFKQFPTLASFAEAELPALEDAVYSTGFYRMKALHIKECAGQLLSQYQGFLPHDIHQLLALSGVGRKTANVIRSHIFQIPSIVVDTHVARVSFRLGLTRHKDPVKIEFELMETLPETHWIRYNQQIITHGRQVCTARSPKCAVCMLKEHCENSKN
jgi:endonuclease-3